MSLSSSHDLHPATGARYVFQRVTPPTGEEPRYEVEVFPAGGARVETTLRWESGAAVLEPAMVNDALRAEVHKLARVVKRTGQDRMTRWRGLDT
jgi:hypothetical protein